MIFFGTRAKTISGQMIEAAPCSNCDKQQFHTFGIIRYFHLYWIPIFPTQKIAGIECTHCKQTLMGKEIPTELSSKIKSTVFTKKNILPTFSGLIIIAGLLLFGGYMVHRSNLRDISYIQQPVLHDLYVVNFNKIFSHSDPKYKYGIIRVKQIAPDQIQFQISKIAYNKTSGARKDIRERKANSDSYYKNDTVSLSREKLKKLKQTGAISTIKRY